MRRLILAPTLALLAVAAPSRAADFGELPLQSVKPSAACVRATGAPGEAVHWSARGAHLLRVGVPGFTPIPLGGKLLSCPVAAAAPGGAAAVAGYVADGVGVALRAPGGGGFAAPVRAAGLRRGTIDDLALAVSPRGDVLVAWLESSESTQGALSFVVRAARRLPGAGFGAPEELARWSRQSAPFPRVLAGMDAGGGATVVWTQPSATSSSTFATELAAAATTAAPGAPFSAPQPLSAAVSGDPALAVAPDGRALVALPGDELDVAEREPGAASFGAPGRISGDSGESTAVALGAGGAAVVAWEADGSTAAALRSGPGPFGPPLALGEPAFETQEVVSGGTIGVGIVGPAGRFPFDAHGDDVRAAFAGDGRAVVTWGARIDSFGVRWGAAHVATQAGDAFAPAQVLGGPLRDAISVAPVIMPARQPAVVWSDDDPQGAGHVHEAVEGAAATPQAAFPTVTVGKPRSAVIARGRPLVLPFSCSAACDVRAALASGATATATRTSAGTAELRVGGDGPPVAPVKPKAVKVTLLSGPPGAIAVQTRTLSFRLRRPSPPPVPRLLSLSAVRHGSEVVVRWTTDRSSRGFDFDVAASNKASFAAAFVGEHPGSAARSFRDTLGGAKVEYVRVTVKFDGRALRSKTVKVRG